MYLIMLDEMTLHDKLNVLQAEMLKFHKEISPVKKQKSGGSVSASEADSKFLSTCISVAFFLLKVSACLIGPTLFPAIVYCVEGSSQLFWQVVAISSAVALLLAMMTVTVLCMTAKKLRTKIKEMFFGLDGIFKNARPFRCTYEVLSSDFMKMNSHKVAYPVVMLLANGFVSYITYDKELWAAFCTSLVVAGFTFGILSSVLCDLLRNPQLLPLHSPCKIKMELSTPSPKGRTELVFNPSYRPPGVAAGSATSSNGNSPFSETLDVAAAIPTNYPSSLNHGETGNSRFYQLHHYFGNFFRNLTSNDREIARYETLQD